VNIGIIGTGMVGQILASKLVEIGHDVMIGTRNVSQTFGRTTGDVYGNPPFKDWHGKNPKVKVGTFAEAARHGEVIINATAGNVSVEALNSAGAAHLKGKVVMDISNPLDFSKGMPPTLSVCNTDSIGEQIQRAFPEAKIVKTLSTTNAHIMVNPRQLAGGDHTIFISGNDADAKAAVSGYLKEWFGWKDVLDLGDITSARGAEMMLPVWLRLYGALKTPAFNFKIVR